MNGEPIIRKVGSGTGAIAVTIPCPGGQAWARLVSLAVKFSGDATQENLVIALDHGLGAAYDRELADEAMSGLNQYVYNGGINLYLEAKNQWGDYAGDAITLAFTNTDALTWTYEAIFERLF